MQNQIRRLSSLNQKVKMDIVLLHSQGWFKVPKLWIFQLNIKKTKVSQRLYCNRKGNKLWEVEVGEILRLNKMMEKISIMDILIRVVGVNPREVWSKEKIARKMLDWRMA